MKKINKNENGFSVIELLLVLIFLAIVVLIGIYVVHNHKSSKTNVSDQSTTSVSNKTALAAGQRATIIANGLLKAGKQGNDGLVKYVDSNVADGYFTSSFKAAVDKRTALPNEGGSPVACTNGIFPDSFAVGATTISGDTAINSPVYIGNGSDVTNSYDQIPQITLSFVNNNWSVVNYICVNNPNSPDNSSPLP